MTQRKTRSPIFGGQCPEEWQDAGCRALSSVDDSRQLGTARRPPRWSVLPCGGSRGRAPSRTASSRPPTSAPAALNGLTQLAMFLLPFNATTYITPSHKLSLSVNTDDWNFITGPISKKCLLAATVFIPLFYLICGWGVHITYLGSGICSQGISRRTDLATTSMHSFNRVIPEARQAITEHQATPVPE